MAQNTIYNSPSCRIESKCDSLILYIKQNNKEAFIFENILDECLKTKPQEKLDKLIKKQGDKYYICKPLSVKYDNINTNTESKESQNNTKTNLESSKTNANKSSECDIKSKRKTIYIKDEISFKNCVFCGEVKFEYISFCELDFCLLDKSEGELKDSNQTSHISQSLRIDFQHSEFRDKVYFTNCEFNGNVFFNHAVFHKYADFHESIFNGIVSFYNATFNSAPNFSTCVFSKLQGTDFINVKIENLKFATIKDFINEYEKDKTYYEELELLREKYSKRAKKLKLFKVNCQQESNKYKENKQKLHRKYQGFKRELTKKHKIRYASNARDSFRTIKNVLIANNNLLDASNWHKLELYAKEQEINLNNPKKFSKDWCDKIQLCFYRHTSAHHTDLLKILSWFIILVGIFATLSFMANCLNDLAKWVSIFWIIACCFIFIKVGLFSALTLLNSIPFFLLLTWNPKYIFGVANLFTNDKSQSDWFANLLMSIYSIFFILVIFSLQKTARKNSIIPN